MAVVISRNDPAFDEALLDRASVAFGVFDGVHEGHRFIIGEAVNTAREEGRASAELIPTTATERSSARALCPMRCSRLIG